jgi:histidinol-phosphatase (PHP family)
MVLDLSGDHHIHTSLCNHAQGTLEEYVQEALAQGLQSMTFLEHMECGLRYAPRIWLTPDLFKQYFDEGQQLQEQYADQIRINLGVEIGYNATALDELLALLEQFPFEHRGLSCHFYDDGKQHLNLLSQRLDHIQLLKEAGSEKVLDTYLTNLIQACQCIPCDKLCHLDAALRHLPLPPFTSHQQHLIRNLLHLLQEKNIALEVNTSGYPLRSRPYPNHEIIQQALALKIPLILGSDAHHPQQVGRFFSQVQEELSPIPYG